MMHAEIETTNVEIIKEETNNYSRKQQWLYSFR